MRSTDRGAARRRLRLPGLGRPIGVSLAAVLLLGSTAGGVGWAESADEAAARADAAAAEVDRIQLQVDLARDRYEAALAGLAGVVNAAVRSDAEAQSAAELARAAALERTQALRTLNQTGGSLALMDTVFTADSPADLAARWQLSQQVLDLLSDRSAEAATTTAAESREAQQLQEQADRQIATVGTVEQAYAELTSLLDQQQEVLDALDSRARRLAAAERAAARLAAERAAAAAAATSSASSATAGGIPKDFLALYQAAAKTCRGLPWPILAAVGQVESGHGSNNGPSASGAEGPMQFLPSTFVAYAVDGDRDGDKDIWDPADAIYSAANYLCANGAGAGPRALYTALWHYNHADWYVLMVVNIAGQIAERFNEPVPVAEKP
jgi:membrane-bound lytic murein transglycosylase B